MPKAAKDDSVGHAPPLEKRKPVSGMRDFCEKSLPLHRRSALSLPATGRGRKVRATQSATQANDLMAVRSWERNRKQPPVKASGQGRQAERRVAA